MNSKLLLMCTLIMGTQSLIRVESCQETDPLDLESYLAKNGLTAVTSLDPEVDNEDPKPVEIRFGNEFSGPAFSDYKQLKNFMRKRLNSIYVGEAWIVTDGAKNYMVHVVPVGILSDNLLTSRFAAKGLEVEGDIVECMKDKNKYIYRKEYHRLADDCLAIEKDLKEFPELIKEFKNNFLIKNEPEIDSALNAELSNYFGPIGERKKIKTSATGSQTAIFQLDNMLKDIVFKMVPKSILQLNEILTLKKLKNEPTGPGFKFCFYEKEGDHAYLVMEKMEYDLDNDKYLKELKKATAKQRVEKFAKIAEAFEKFHTFGLVHDDIKPGNIMVDANNNIRVIDVGISVEEGALSPPASQNVFRPPGRGNRVPLKQTNDVQALSLAFCLLNANALEIQTDDPQEEIKKKYPKDQFISDVDFHKEARSRFEAQFEEKDPNKMNTEVDPNQINTEVDPNKMNTEEDKKKMTFVEIMDKYREEIKPKYNENGEQIFGKQIYYLPDPPTIRQLFQNRIKRLYEQSTKLEAPVDIDSVPTIKENFLKDLEKFWQITQFPFNPSLDTEVPLSPDAVLTWALIPEAQLPGAVKVTMTELKTALEKKAAEINLIRIRI